MLYHIDDYFVSDKTKLEIIHTFIRFLKENGAYVLYKKRFYSGGNRLRNAFIQYGYCNIGLISYLMKISCDDFVSRGFNTDGNDFQGWEVTYWFNINEKWRDMMFYEIKKHIDD